MDHFDHPGRVLSGPVSGYPFFPHPGGSRYPTILHIGGYDGTAEELYPSVAPLSIAAARLPHWENVLPGMFDAVAAGGAGHGGRRPLPTDGVSAGVEVSTLKRHGPATLSNNRDTLRTAHVHPRPSLAL